MEQSTQQDQLVAAEKPLTLVSVITPCHNDRSYLKEALLSCINNTYPLIEIIIIDDCSNIPLEISSLGLDFRSRKVTLIRNAVNRGSGYSRNVGIKAAQGELIAFLDADDIWLPEIIEKQVAVFDSDRKVSWVYTDGYYLMNGHKMSRPNSYYHGFHTYGFPAGKDVNACHLQGYNYMTFSSNMIRKSALLEVGLFNETLRVSEDWDLFVRIAERFEACPINEPLMIYRINNSGRHFVNRDDYVTVNINILQGLYERQNLLPDQQPELDRAVAMVYERAGIQRLNAGLTREAQPFLFHPKVQPLAWRLRTICLRLCSLLPPFFYRIALWCYDHS